MVRIPFSILPERFLESKSTLIIGVGEKLRVLFPFLSLNLRRADIDIEARKYVSMCVLASSAFFVAVIIILTFGLFVFEIKKFYIVGPAIAFFLSFFVFFIQVNYPRIIANRKVRGVERNLLPALRNLVIQMNSGVPLFNILVSISAGKKYGEVSEEFSEAIKEINAGTSETLALEKIAEKNPSLYFRRAIWQVVNGMRSGADISIILEEVIEALSEEQLVQIQAYGAQLNPLAMFYMLLAVIIPALSVTFIISISSFTALTETSTKLLFGAVLVFVVIFQILFLGIIKTKRPSLLGEE